MMENRYKVIKLGRLPLNPECFMQFKGSEEFIGV